MDLKEFIANFAEQFDDTDASEIQADTEFHELDEWGSLTGMEIRECITVQDLFNLVAEK